MRILYLCTFYHIAMLYNQQKKALEERGHEVLVFNSTSYGTIISDKFIPVLQDKDVVHVECWNKLDRLFFFPRQWKIERLLEKTYDLSSFDLMHAHLLVSSGYTARRMKKKYGLKYVVSVRATDLNGFIRLPFFRQLAIKNAEESEGLLFLSRCHKTEFMNKYVPIDKRELFEKKSVIIGNPLEKYWETNRFNARSLKNSNRVSVLLVGRITPIKNIPVAAEAIRLLRDNGMDVTLTVIGDVEDKKEEAKIRKYSFVKQLPFMSQDKLIEEYRTHDIFLLPSRVETFGRVYVEAMSQGIPVLYSKGQGFDGTYPDGIVGYSVPCDDPFYISERIKDVINNYDVLSDNCVKKVSDFYEDRIMDSIERFYCN